MGRSGADRIRTDDLLLAKQALSQLSYGPVMLTNPRRATRSSPSGSARFIPLGLLLGLYDAPLLDCSPPRSVHVLTWCLVVCVNRNGDEVVCGLHYLLNGSVSRVLW